MRLIRSKGVGVYFITQNPRDVPDNVLGQLGNRVQHALRAFTPRDQKAVQAAADTFRPNPKLNTAQAIMELGVGEALVSCLVENGQPQIVERAFIVPPRSQIGPISPQQRQQLMANSLVAGVYDKVIDRESAYEKLTQAVQQAPTPSPEQQSSGGFWGRMFGGGSSSPTPAPAPRTSGPPGRQPDSMGTMIAKTATRVATTAIVGTIARGFLGSIFGGGRRRR